MAKKRRPRKQKRIRVSSAKRQPLGPASEQGSRYSIEEVFSCMREAISKAGKVRRATSLRFQTKDGESWRLSLRMRTFLQHGTQCRYCKLQGAYFQAERFSIQETCMHLNLYAIDDEGDEVLMTHDHVMPKASGGRNCLDNTDTVCFVCNMFKKDMVPSFKIVKNEDS